MVLSYEDRSGLQNREPFILHAQKLPSSHCLPTRVGLFESTMEIFSVKEKADCEVRRQNKELHLFLTWCTFHLQTPCLVKLTPLHAARVQLSD